MISFESVSAGLKKYGRIAFSTVIGYTVGDAIYQKTGDEKSSVMVGVLAAFAANDLSKKTEGIVSAKVDQIRAAKAQEEEDDEDDLDEDFFDQIDNDLEYSGDDDLEFPHGNYQDQMEEKKDTPEEKKEKAEKK